MLKHAFGSTARRWRAAHQSELRVKEYVFFVWLRSHILAEARYPKTDPDGCSDLVQVVQY